MQYTVGVCTCFLLKQGVLVTATLFYFILKFWLCMHVHEFCYAKWFENGNMLLMSPLTTVRAYVQVSMLSFALFGNNGDLLLRKSNQSQSCMYTFLAGKV